jgi:fructose-bisphosphate aldolase class 1
MDGEHTIEKTIEVQTQVVAEVYRACIANGVYLPGSLLKPSMTVPGVECKEKVYTYTHLFNGRFLMFAFTVSIYLHVLQIVCL